MIHLQHVTNIIFSIIPSQEHNSIARVQPKESDSYFKWEYMDEKTHIIYNVYNPVGSIAVQVPTEEVIGLISLLQDDGGPKWKVDAASNLHSNTFWIWITPHFPAHAAITFDQPFEMSFVVVTSTDGNNKKKKGCPCSHEM